jgi:hypothetical protein
VICLDLLVHLLLDARKILWRDAVTQFEIVVKPVLDGWPSGELCLGPKAQYGRREHVGARMTNALQLACLIMPFRGGFLRYVSHVLLITNHFASVREQEESGAAQRKPSLAVFRNWWWKLLVCNSFG